MAPDEPVAPIRARLATAQGDPEIGEERIVVYHDDRPREEVRLHDYARLYALPGVYEQIVSEDLGCRSPEVVAQMLGRAVDALGDGWPGRAGTRVIDLAAGNGISGEAIAAEGMTPVLGTDIVPAARAAALRDRPGVYGDYLTLDLLALSAEQTARLRGLEANALTCVAPVGDAPGQVPGAAFAAAVAVLGADALTVHLHDPRFGVPDLVDEAFWPAALGREVLGTRLDHRRYVHRLTVAGAPYELEASVWRVRLASDSSGERPTWENRAHLMPANPQATGKTYPPSRYAVGREKIVEYALATGERDPLHLDVAAARSAGHADLVAPPMFVVVYQGRALAPAMFDPELGIDFAHLLHSAQEFRWGPLVVAGDEVTSTVTVESVRERAGVEFFVFGVESANQRGEVVATGTWTNIVRPPEEG